jgi:FdhD protein
MPGDAIFDVFEINGSLCRAAQAHVCEDRPVRVYLNDTLAGSFEACPGDLESLARGYLLCEGLVATGGDIESVRARGDDLLVRAQVGSPRSDFFNENFMLDARVLLERYCSMETYSPMRHLTGGNHCAAIFTASGGLIAFAEDAQRLGCLYKVVGKAASTGYDLGECFVISTGRVSPWSVRAVRQAGMPLLASFGVPSARAVQEARRSGITLVTVTRLAQVIIYSHIERVTGLPGEASGYLLEYGIVNYR